MKLSIIMPVYNEIESIEHILRRVSEVKYDKEIIIVDDGSKDGTREFLKNNKADFDGVKVFYHDVNSGKTAAIRTALKYITGDIVIIQDADLEYNPTDYKQLIEPIISGEFEVVYGSRFLNLDKRFVIWHWFLNKFLGRHYEVIYLSHFFGILFLNLLAFLLYGVKITDIATGYKVFKSEIIKEIWLDTNRFEFCYEITAKIAKRNIRIKEVPIKYHPRSILKGKKITWKDGIRAALTLIKYKFKNIKNESHTY
ncbi:MAG: glycosyltransferase family 2 protein [Candidatus Omnitrophota bacterium]|nr:glycosyltransferase family 2 protein [Candidatus Omnitrophota bacterium]